MFRIRWWPEEVPIDLSNLPPDSRRVLLREVLDELVPAGMKSSGKGSHVGPDYDAALRRVLKRWGWQAWKTRSCTSFRPTRSPAARSSLHLAPSVRGRCSAVPPSAQIPIWASRWCWRFWRTGRVGSRSLRIVKAFAGLGRARACLRQGGGRYALRCEPHKQPSGRFTEPRA